MESVEYAKRYEIHKELFICFEQFGYVSMSIIKYFKLCCYATCRQCRLHSTLPTFPFQLGMKRIKKNCFTRNGEKTDILYKVTTLCKSTKDYTSMVLCVCFCFPIRFLCSVWFFFWIFMFEWAQHTAQHSEFGATLVNDEFVHQNEDMKLIRWLL